MSEWPRLFVKVKRLRKSALMPIYASENAAGADVHVDLMRHAFDPSVALTIEGEGIGNGLKTIIAERRGDTAVALMVPGHCYALPTGLAMEIPVGWHGQLKDRSGMAARGQVTHVGVIDPDYRGEMHVIVRCHELMMIGHGDRIGQILFIPTGRAVLEEADELSETERGSGGYGSTGR